MRLAADLSYRFARGWQTSLGGGYSFNVASAVGTERILLRSRTGPFVRLSVFGRLTEIWSVQISGSASNSHDFNDNVSNNYGLDVNTMLRLSSRVFGMLGGGIESSDFGGMPTLSLNARASVFVMLTSWLYGSVMGQHIGNDGTPVQVGSLSLGAFFWRHLSLQASTTVERSEDETLWSMSIGTQVRF
jgi:hypothetical protein